MGAHQGVVSLTRGPDWSQAINAVSLTDKYAAWTDYAEMPGGAGIYAWLCEENRPVRFTHRELEAHPRWHGFGAHAKDHPPMRGWLAAPLVGRDGRNLGLIQLSDKEDGGEFDEADEAMLVQLAQLASAAVEQAQTEADLRESEARLRLALQAGQLAEVTFHLDNGELTHSASFAELLGHSPEKRITLTEFRSQYHPEDRDRVLAQRASILEGGPDFYEVEKRIVRPDGEIRWVYGRGSVSRDSDGKAVSVSAVYLDETERKQIELALRESEARLRELNEMLETRVAERTAEREALASIVENTGAAVQALDPGYRWIAINAAAADSYERIYGVRPRVADSMQELMASQPEEWAKAKAVWDRALGGEAFTTMASWGDPGLAVRTFDMRFEVLRNDQGVVTGAFLTGIDVTERVEAEARLQEAEAALRQSQKMEAMGQLTGGVAHDFNNLLTPIIASLDMLLRRGIGSERERRLVDGALQSAERAKTLVQRLLAFARRQPLQPGPVDLRRLVGGMAELIASTSGPRIDVRVNLPDDLPPALADANQLEMALLNLAVNANDAMPDAGVLTISAGRESVQGAHPAKLRPGHYVRLSVGDTGVGMDEQTLARAVEPFFSTKGIGKGTGLGLSMVHGLASQLGGGLTIASRPGHGTTVNLWLPISPVAVEEESGTDRPTSAPQSLGMALMVDDEDLVRLSVADMLVDLGYEVREASSAKEAWRMVQEGLRPDLVVTDHLMPGMTGLELARALRSSQPDLPVVIVSGYAEMEGVAPGFPRLTKPFRSADLAACLAAVADGKT